LLPPTKLHDALCYICAMVLKDLAIAAMLVSLAFVPAASTAQTANPPSPTAGATTPAASPASGPGAASPAPQTNCQGGPCDAPPPHITIATPAPAPAPWPLQERISWAANLILVLIAYMGVMLGLSALRKIERQTRFGETAAQAAAESAKAALLLAQAQERAERPWIVISPEPVPGTQDSFTVVATNRGRSPARVVSLVDEIATARDESHLPPAPAFKTAPRAPHTPSILLPGETAEIKSFSRGDVKAVCESAEELRHLEEWEVKIFLYGRLNYVDLRSVDETEMHETSWCCWYIHGRQKSGLVIAGTPEYNRHT
jgi:hypothetical protein